MTPDDVSGARKALHSKLLERSNYSREEWQGRANKLALKRWSNAQPPEGHKTAEEKTLVIVNFFRFRRADRKHNTVLHNFYCHLAEEEQRERLWWTFYLVVRLLACMTETRRPWSTPCESIISEAA
jgi:hypothetical protein